MTKWCKGCLKVRGRVAAVKRFILEGLEPVNFFGDGLPKLEISVLDDVESDNYCRIKGTTRGFVEKFYVDFSVVEDGETFTAVLDATFAWAANADELLALCRKYEVDMKLYAFEKGARTNQDISIVGGLIIRNCVIRFEDYDWECICPTLGG